MSAHFSALDDEEFFVVEGSGWRGRRESDSQVFCHLNSMHALAFSWINTIVILHCPHHHHHPGVSVRESIFVALTTFSETSVVAIDG